MPVPVPAHPVPGGPLAVRWLSHEIGVIRAGAPGSARVELENAGTAEWRSGAGSGIYLAYHWLDLLGNPIVWGGIFTALPRAVRPGDRCSVDVRLRGPIPPGRYRLAFDLVNEGTFWFEEVGNQRLEVDLDVRARLAERTLAVHLDPDVPELRPVTEAALAEQEELLVPAGAVTAFLAAGCRPAPDWSRRVLDTHEEGFAAVGGSIEVLGGRLARRRAQSLKQWRPGFGRSPSWRLPLLCPSVVTELAHVASWGAPVAGLPTLDPGTLGEPWLCDGRIRIAVDARALRPSGR